MIVFVFWTLTGSLNQPSHCFLALFSPLPLVHAHLSFFLAFPLTETCQILSVSWSVWRKTFFEHLSLCLWSGTWLGPWWTKKGINVSSLLSLSDDLYPVFCFSPFSLCLSLSFSQTTLLLLFCLFLSLFPPLSLSPSPALYTQCDMEQNRDPKQSKQAGLSSSPFSG